MNDFVSRVKKFFQEIIIENNEAYNIEMTFSISKNWCWSTFKEMDYMEG